MFELLVGLAAILAILLIAAAFYAYTYRAERDEALQDLTIAKADITALNNRLTTLRADNIILEKANHTLSDGFDAVASERDALKAALKVEPPKRGPNGRFVPRVKKPAPISCG